MPGAMQFKHAGPRKKRTKQDYGVDTVERYLLTVDFREQERTKGQQASLTNSRRKFVRGNWKVLSPVDDFPWWTVQRWAGSQCNWFVDFSVNVPVSNIAGFIEGRDG